MYKIHVTRIITTTIEPMDVDSIAQQQQTQQANPKPQIAEGELNFAVLPRTHPNR